MDALVKVDIIVNTLSRSQKHFSMTRTHKSTKPQFLPGVVTAELY